MLRILDTHNVYPPTTPTTSMTLDIATFQQIVHENLSIVNKAFQDQFIIPDFEWFCEDIKGIFRSRDNDTALFKEEWRDFHSYR